MQFLPSKEMKVQLLPGQDKMLSTPENIRTIIAQNPETVVAFDIYEDHRLAGFALLHNFKPGCWFLWEYAIDHRFQGRRLGKRALQALMAHMATHHGMHTMTTTYLHGNEPARRLYQGLSFVVTDEVDNDETHEFNMICHYRNDIEEVK